MSFDKLGKSNGVKVNMLASIDCLTQPFISTWLSRFQ